MKKWKARNPPEAATWQVKKQVFSVKAQQLAVINKGAFVQSRVSRYLAYSLTNVCKVRKATNWYSIDVDKAFGDRRNNLEKRVIEGAKTFFCA